MKLILTISTCMILLALSTQPLQAQFASGNHTVTVNVAPVSLLQLSGGALNLDISMAQAVAGQDLMTVSDNSTQLLWGTNNSAQKITAATDLAAPLFALQVEVSAPTQGSPMGPVTLSTTASDILLNLARSSGTCTVTYTALVLASQGTGTETHNVTFTIQTQ